MNYRDVELQNQAFSSLADTILRNRQLQEAKAERQQDRSTQASQFAAEQALRQRQLADTEEEQKYARDPNNPQNKRETALSQIAQEQVKRLGVKNVHAEWETQDGQKVSIDGSLDEIRAAQQQAPPSPTAKITSRFVTKDGVEHTVNGTAAQLKAQQDALTQQGGGINQGGMSYETDPETGVRTPVYTDRKGNVHVIKENDDGTITTTTKGTSAAGPVDLTTTRTKGARQPGNTTKPPTVTTQAQFDALPSGAIYIGKDNKQYQKP